MAPIKCALLMDRRLNNFACRIDMDIMNFAYAGF
jgi:hypothetical protein